MIFPPDDATIDALVRILRKARSVLFITGAGVSAESGIPTYRGIGGNMHSLSCTRCKYAVTIDEFDTLEIPPKCPNCGALVRPDVVLFGELIDGPPSN